MPEASLFSVFLVGLLGGTHCVGMCGGLVSALSFKLPGSRAQLPYHGAASAGRIVSYMAAGCIAGALGAGTLAFRHFLPVEEILYLVANGMLILLGLYLANLWRVLVHLERAGGMLWRRLQPLMGRFVPIASWPQAFAAGLVWGWLPCGLVYNVLVSALASGSPWRGALLMGAFGLGTAPNLLAMGVFARELGRLVRNAKVRLGAGLLIAGFGALGLFRLARLWFG